MADDYLVSNADLAAWAETDEATVEADPLALQCRYGATVTVRAYGRDDWTMATIPERARTIAVLLAKNAYTNPRNQQSTTVGPLSDGFRPADFTVPEEWQRELAALAKDGTLESLDSTGGFLGFGRIGDEDEKDPDPFFVTDQSGSDWKVPWYDPDQVPVALPPSSTGMSGTFWHSIVARQPISAYMVMDSTGSVMARTNPDDMYAQPMITVVPGSTGDPVKCAASGILANAAWAMIPGVPVWIGDDGLLVQAAPVTPGWQRQVGYAYDAVTLWIDPQPGTPA